MGQFVTDVKNKLNKGPSIASRNQEQTLFGEGGCANLLHAFWLSFVGCLRQANHLTSQVDRHVGLRIYSLPLRVASARPSMRELNILQVYYSRPRDVSLAKGWEI